LYVERAPKNGLRECRCAMRLAASFLLVVTLLLSALGAALADPASDAETARIRAFQAEHWPTGRGFRSLYATSWACASIGAAKLAGGQGYRPGTYLVTLIGGHGDGAMVHVDVGANGAVVSATWERTGTGYRIGDVLTSNDLGSGGSG